MGIVKHMGVLVLSLVAFSAYGQKVSVSTNVLGYLNFGTLNAEVSYEGELYPRKRKSEDGNVDRHHQLSGLLHCRQRAQALLRHHQPGGHERQLGA